jgi:CubicO group peptidase (beta-lactamase class C family)
VSDVLAKAIARHDVPGMVAAVIEGDRVVAVGAAGVRKRGGAEKVTADDRFHIGSCTKAMTATLCAMLVEEGKLKWDSTVVEVFPSAAVHAGYRTVTLEQLLTNRGGAPGDVEPALWKSLWSVRAAPTQARKALFDGVLSQPPAATPGTEFIYSNAGFAVAGHMAEKVGRKPWEELTREKVFRPLGMNSAGFGPPGKRVLRGMSQPWGHQSDGTPVAPDDPGADNPVAIAPAGLVHCTVGDWAKFVALHLQGARGEGKLLKKQTFQKLHAAPEGSSYAMGWNVGPSPLGEGTALSHAGSNTMWYAVAWILPQQNVAAVVMCNQGGPGGPGERACDEVSGSLLRRHLKAGSN